jgi:hypothetical protein
MEVDAEAAAADSNGRTSLFLGSSLRSTRWDHWPTRLRVSSAEWCRVLTSRNVSVLARLSKGLPDLYYRKPPDPIASNLSSAP